MPPHPGHPDIHENFKHKSGYPFEEIQVSFFPTRAQVKPFPSKCPTLPSCLHGLPSCGAATAMSRYRTLQIINTEANIEIRFFMR